VRSIVISYPKIQNWLWFALRRPDDIFVMLTCAILAIAGYFDERLLVGREFSPLIWSLVVLSVVVDSWRLARFVYSSEQRLIQILVAGIMFQLLSSLIVTSLGFVGILSLVSQIAAVGIIRLSTVLLILRQPVLREPPEKFLHNTQSGEFGLRATGKPNSSEFDPIRDPKLSHGKLYKLRTGPYNFLVVGAISLAVLTWAIATRNQVLYIVMDDDNMGYHLPMVAEWIRSGSIWFSEPNFVEPRLFFPGFKESIIAFLSLPMGNEHLGILGTLELPLFAFSIYLLSRRYGASQTLAVVLGAYAATTPAAFTTAVIQRNDLALAVNLCSSILLMQLYLDNPTGSRAVVGGLAVGAVAATKYSGAVYSVLVVIGAFIEHWERNDKRIGAVHLKRLGLVLLSATIVAGPWYIRNMLTFGNPLYPGQVTIAGWTIFPGVWNQLQPAIGWDIRPLLVNYWHWIQAFGVLVPIYILSPLVLIFAVPQDRNFMRRACARLFLPLSLFVGFLHHPANLPSFGWHYNLRYALPWFSVSAVVGVPGMALRWRPFAQVAPFVIFGASLINIKGWTRWWLLVVAMSLLVAACSFLIDASSIKLPSSMRLLPLSRVLTLLVVLGFLSSYVNATRARLQYDPAYGYHDLPGNRGWGAVASYVHRNLKSQTIVVHGNDEVFPLYGEPFSNVVIFAGERLNPNDLMALVGEKKAEYIATFPLILARRGAEDFEYTEGIAPALLKAYPGKLKVVLENRGAYLFKVEKGS
jgi:hypothetical protein